MSCIVLIGGIIGCGKTTLVKFILDNKLCLKYVEKEAVENLKGDQSKYQSNQLCTMLFDDFCNIEEQAQLMKTLKGWRNYRSDFLIAAEHFISNLCSSKCIVPGPLPERSLDLFKRINQLNETCLEGFDTIFLVEDNFYYRSMRYDWFQIARRANIGFCEIFVQCPCSVAIQRNSTRGYNIPEQKIKMMLSLMEYPQPLKYKWEKFSMQLDSFSTFECSSLKEMEELIYRAAENPAEQMINQEKVASQNICLRNAIHQADIILRKIVARKISQKKSVTNGENLKAFVVSATRMRQELLYSLKQNLIHIPEDLLTNLQTLGIKSVQDRYEIFLNELFESSRNESVSELEFKLKNLRFNN